MKGTGRKKNASVALFVLVLVVIVPPFIRIYDVPSMVFGVPASYVALFVLWALVIVATALIGSRPVPPPPGQDPFPDRFTKDDLGRGGSGRDEGAP